MTKRVIFPIENLYYHIKYSNIIKKYKKHSYEILNIFFKQIFKILKDFFFFLRKSDGPAHTNYIYI
jgi:hypothetical protein